jgi:hypothetical protein
MRLAMTALHRCARPYDPKVGRNRFTLSGEDAMKIFGCIVMPQRVLALLLPLFLTACGGSLSDSLNPVQIDALVFSAELNGAQETPPNNSPAVGVGLAIVNAKDLSFSASVVTTGMTDTLAHIHEAPPNVAGPVAFPMTKEPGKVVWNVKGTLTQAQLDTMRAGGFYFNVHSPTFTEGEIRGQIVFRLPTRDQLQRLSDVAQQSQVLQDMLQKARQQNP